MATRFNKSNSRARSLNKHRGCSNCLHYDYTSPSKEWVGCFCDGDGYYMFIRTKSTKCSDWEQDTRSSNPDTEVDIGDDFNVNFGIF